MPPNLNETEVAALRQQAIEWLVRLRSDSISEDEIRDIANWLAQDYRHSEAFAYAEDLFDAMVLAESPLPAQNPPAETQPPLRQQSTARRIESKMCCKRWLSVALTLAFACLFAMVWITPENFPSLATIWRSSGN